MLRSRGNVPIGQANREPLAESEQLRGPLLFQLPLGWVAPARHLPFGQVGNRQADQVTLKAVCGPGDGAEPVITIMLLDED